MQGGEGEERKRKREDRGKEGRELDIGGAGRRWKGREKERGLGGGSEGDPRVYL